MTTAGAAPEGATAAVFCAATQLAVEAFQARRGLHVTGDCDEATWSALIEAGWSLGDRLLLLTAPQLRGDDVAALQSGLNHLGFDCGRPDGIFGPATTRALTDFQRHAGLPADGVCGANTVRTLTVLARQSGTGPGIASMREQLALDELANLETARIVVGQFGGLSSLTRLVARDLRARGATVISTDEPDAPAQAAVANRFGATAYIGFEVRLDLPTRVAYFAVPVYESLGGRRLAVAVARELRTVGGIGPGDDDHVDVVGMRLPVLRETRMPAVLIGFGVVRDVVDRAAELAAATSAAFAQWRAGPTERAPIS